MAPGHILQIFLRVTVQICLTALSQWSVVLSYDKV